MSKANIYNKLLAGIGNVYGVCGLMGNIRAESNFCANNAQNSGNVKLGMTDEQYTTAVDNGTYKNFVKDSIGYGLVQWTYSSRKQNLYNYLKGKNLSIGDENGQIEFLLQELKAYKTVWQTLVGAKSIKEASDAVLHGFEKPANQSATVEATRAKYGEEIYNEFNSMKGDDFVRSRAEVVKLVTSWLGKNESDGSYKSIIDIYNSYKGTFPRGTKMQYNWAWCACTWSALAIKLGYTDIMPIEISCYYLIEAAKKMGIWVENDAYVPKSGDGVLYDWDDNGVGDCNGSPDHVGTVVEVNGSTFVVIEGNYSNSVKKRTMSVNGRYIRGFITPKYTTDGTVTKPVVSADKDIETLAREVIAGTYGTGDARKAALGSKYAEVQAKVNEILNGKATKPAQTTTTVEKAMVANEYAQSKSDKLAGTYKTTADLYLRKGAGTNKKAMTIIPKGTSVTCYGYYTDVKGIAWLYIQVTLDGVKYTGFSSSEYLKK